jgi:hypothetical protein
MERRTERGIKLLARRLQVDVGVPQPFDLHGFLQNLAQYRNRDLLLRPLTDDIGPDTCGVFLEIGNVDVIGIHPGASPWHRAHIALHEVFHMLAGHRGEPAAAPLLLAAVLPHLDPEGALVSRALARAHFTPEEEAAAELGAQTVLSRALPPPSEHVDRGTSLDSAVRDRLEAALSTHTVLRVDRDH